MQLASEGRANEDEVESLPLCPVPHRRRHQVEEPTVQLPTSSLAYVLLLGLGLELQVFENQHRILRNPFAESSGGFLTERLVAVSGFPRQPFQRSTNRPGVESLCLLLGEFGLQTRPNLARLGVPDGQGFAADEQRLLVRRSDQGVVDTEVDADGNDAFGVWDFEGDAEESCVRSNAKAIDALGGIEGLAEVVRDSPSDFLSTLKCRDGKTSVSPEREVFTNKEECRRFSENEGTGCRSVVGLGRSIGRCGRSDGVATHLRGQSCWSLMIDQLMQLEGTKRLSIVEADWTDGLLVTVELRYCFIDEGVFVEYNRYGSLDIHTDKIVIHPKKTNCEGK